MNEYIATEIAYKNGYAAGQKVIVNKLKELYTDLDKILDAAEQGKVPIVIDDGGNPIEWTNYTMSSNAELDVYNIQRGIRRLLVEMDEVVS